MGPGRALKLDDAVGDWGAGSSVLGPRSLEAVYQHVVRKHGEYTRAVPASVLVERQGLLFLVLNGHFWQFLSNPCEAG